METFITHSAEETIAVGQRLAGERNRIICLYGELGSGKTTFVQGFAKGLGITKRIVSPTFIIVRRYALPKASHGFLYHLDLYRFQSENELEELGLDEIFADSESFVIIEWAEKLTENLPQNRIDIWFSIDEKGRHQITVKENKI